MKYTCPHHPEIISDKPGKCPKCGGMDLVPVDQVHASHQETSFVGTYYPLIVIIGFIFLSSTVASYSNGFELDQWMRYFMAGFFLVFSGFKFLDLKGFAQGYSTYDLLAQRMFSYGYIYPFIELGLGLAYLAGFTNQIVLGITLVVMTFSGLGVLQSIQQKRKFQCACLGTIIKVPLTKVTLIEDFGMAIMAGIMLVLR